MARKHFNKEYNFSGWNGSDIFLDKICVECKEPFRPKSGVQKFCSSICKGKYQYTSGRLSTENQYFAISGNWKRYFARLVGKAKERENLSITDLMYLYNLQEGKCALTGVTLTCTLEKGNRCYTNASLDRIIPGGPYDMTNVRLVCWRVNWMRSNMSDEELVYWCNKIINGPGKKGEGNYGT